LDKLDSLLEDTKRIKAEIGAIEPNHQYLRQIVEKTVKETVGTEVKKSMKGVNILKLEMANDKDEKNS
jgi:ribonucleotide reductase alpha subunit